MSIILPLFTRCSLVDNLPIAAGLPRVVDGPLGAAHATGPLVVNVAVAAHPLSFVHRPLAAADPTRPAPVIPSFATQVPLRVELSQCAAILSGNPGIQPSGTADFLEYIVRDGTATLSAWGGVADVTGTAQLLPALVRLASAADGRGARIGDITAAVVAFVRFLPDDARAADLCSERVDAQATAAATTAVSRVLEGLGAAARSVPTELLPHPSAAAHLLPAVVGHLAAAPRVRRSIVDGRSAAHFARERVVRHFPARWFWAFRFAEALAEV